ncbi:MAG: hypothetical protein WAP47_06715 [Candidatus Rokuibacteriota bacterium]
MTVTRPLAVLALLASSTGVAEAHATGRAHILLLPTHLYILGGAVAVAASFLLIPLIPSERFRRLGALGRRLGVVNPPAGLRWVVSVCPSLLSLLLVLSLIAAGSRGSGDPLANPLPLFVWTVWWIGLTYLHVAFGNLWVHVNPWSGLYRLVTSGPRWRQWRAQPPLAFPGWAGRWPALVLFLAFAWFELIHPAPSDPSLLAGVVASYLVVNVLGMFLFGEGPWLQSAEAFSVFFRMISWLSPLAVRVPTGSCRECRLECRASPNCLDCSQCLSADGPKAVDVTLPALNLLSVRELGLSGVAFVLLALASVSFDGLSRTFFWLDLIGVNPLEYPGRTALIAVNTAGLLGVFAALALAFAAVLSSARVLSGPGGGAGQAPGAFVLAIVPIAVGYHIAHYLPVFLVDVQYAARSASDPLGRGWDLFGTGDLHVIASFLSDPFWVYWIWCAQVVIIVVAHVAAIYVAHLLALRLSPSGRAAMIGQLPMTLLMVGYTVFGLWLLSTPAVG